MDQALTIDIPKNCPVCSSPYMAYVRNVLTLRTKRPIPLYACLTCRSFTNPSGYIEGEAQLLRDLEWHRSVEQRNTKAAGVLLKSLKQTVKEIKCIVEIGCGSGTLLRAAKEEGVECIGFDINRFAIEYGIKKHGLDLRTEFWSADTRCGIPDMILCISVMEHMVHPRELFSEIAKASRKYSAWVFISVPFLNEDKWIYILDPDPYRDNTPFFDNDVHVTHFSDEGMKLLAHQHNVKYMKRNSSTIWHGYLMKF
jgi:2-polyprenyl-3-methyl-5-hydroxy-6-metoxy-1,4-benzoquinol methylase